MNQSTRFGMTVGVAIAAIASFVASVLIMRGSSDRFHAVPLENGRVLILDQHSGETAICVEEMEELECGPFARPPNRPTAAERLAAEAAEADLQARREAWDTRCDEWLDSNPSPEDNQQSDSNGWQEKARGLFGPNRRTRCEGAIGPYPSYSRE